MPSFDVVSTVDMQEVENAINQARKEIASRYDFRGSKAEIIWDKEMIIIKGDDDYKMGAIKDILISKVHRRSVDISCLDFSKPEAIGGMLQRQEVKIKQGIDKETSKKINKSLKEEKLKIQTQISGEKLKVTSKSIDTLQEAIAFLKSKNFGVPLQFENMRN